MTNEVNPGTQFDQFAIWRLLQHMPNRDLRIGLTSLVSEIPLVGFSGSRVDPTAVTRQCKRERSWDETEQTAARKITPITKLLDVSKIFLVSPATTPTCRSSSPLDPCVSRRIVADVVLQNGLRSLLAIGIEHQKGKRKKSSKITLKTSIREIPVYSRYPEGTPKKNLAPLDTSLEDPSSRGMHSAETSWTCPCSPRHLGQKQLGI